MDAVNEELEKSIPRKADERFMERTLGKATYKYDSEAITKAILDPTWHLLGNGGKRWRPTLMLLMIEALGKDPKKYMEFAIVPEIIHNATLIHDDIEDRSQTRRGVPAVHVKYGDDIAVNLGGYLYYFAMSSLMGSNKLDDGTKERIYRVYMQEMLRVHTGQATDIAWHNFLVPIEKITEDDYLQMIYNKSGVLARLACKLGSILAGADDNLTATLGHLGASIGVAFQLQDDLLNITPNKVSESKGGVGDDITEGKITLMVIRAVQTAGQKDKDRLMEILKMHTRDKQLIAEAIKIMADCKANEYVEKRRIELAKGAWDDADKLLIASKAKDRIRSLIDFLVTRKN